MKDMERKCASEELEVKAQNNRIEFNLLEYVLECQQAGGKRKATSKVIYGRFYY